MVRHSSMPAMVVAAAIFVAAAGSLSLDDSIGTAYAAGSGSTTSDLLLINGNYHQMDVRTNPAILSGEDAHVMMYMSLTNVDTTPDPALVSGVEYSIRFADGSDPSITLATLDAYAPGEELAIMIMPSEGQAKISGESTKDGVWLASGASPVDLEAPIFLKSGIVYIYVTVNSINSQAVSEDDDTFDLMFSMGEYIPFTIDIDGVATDLVFATYFDRIDEFTYDAQTRTVSAHMPFTWTDEYIESTSFIHAEYYIPRTVDLFDDNEILLAINGMDYFGTVVRSGGDEIEIHYLLSTNKLKELMETLEPEYAGKMVFEMRAGDARQEQTDPNASLEAGDTVIIRATDDTDEDTRYDLHLSADPAGMIHPQSDLTFLLDIVDASSGKPMTGTTYDLEIILGDDVVLAEDGRVTSKGGDKITVEFMNLGTAALVVSNIGDSNAGGKFSFVVSELHDMSAHGGHSDEHEGHSDEHEGHSDEHEGHSDEHEGYGEDNGMKGHDSMDNDEMHKEHDDLLSAHKQMMAEHREMMSMMEDDDAMMEHDAMMQDHDKKVQEHDRMMRGHHDMMMTGDENDGHEHDDKKMAEFDVAMQEHDRMMQEHNQMMDTHNEMLIIQEKEEQGNDPDVIVETGGCLIATATFGSEMAPHVQQLRELRDNTILATSSGTAFMSGFNQIYYTFSPTVADLERENPAFRDAVKVALTPMLLSLSLLDHVDIDTEAEMLGYGVSVLLLNIGMYVGAPAAAAVLCARLARRRLFAA